MNKKALAIAAILIAASVGTGLGYQTLYELSNVDASIRDSNVHIDNSNVTLGENVTITNPPANQPQPSEPPEELPYDYVIYEWHLKAEYINNVTWLNSTRGKLWSVELQRNVPLYNASQTWLENYFALLSDCEWRLANNFFSPPVDVFVTAEFDETTGWTRAVYVYKETNHPERWNGYGVEVWLNAKNVTVNGWTKTLA